MEQHKITLEFSRKRFAFAVSDSGICGFLAHLFRYHARFADTDGEVQIELTRGDFGARKKPVLLECGAGFWRWGVPVDAHEWLSERFYYRVLHPVLFSVFPTRRILRLQGALLADECLGPVMLLGDRGHGKTTVTAGWLQGGGGVVTDKTILVTGEPWSYGGIYRELHVDPILLPVLSGLPNLEEAEEYLPGRTRLKYDWIKNFPDRFTRYVGRPKHIIASSVAPSGKTTVRQLGRASIAEAVSDNLSLEQENLVLPRDTLDELISSLEEACGWEIVWGSDLLMHPGLHYDFLTNVLAGMDRSKGRVGSR